MSWSETISLTRKKEELLVKKEQLHYQLTRIDKELEAINKVLLEQQKKELDDLRGDANW